MTSYNAGNSEYKSPGDEAASNSELDVHGSGPAIFLRLSLIHRVCLGSKRLSCRSLFSRPKKTLERQTNSDFLQVALPVLSNLTRSRISNSRFGYVCLSHGRTNQRPAGRSKGLQPMTIYLGT